MFGMNKGIVAGVVFWKERLRSRREGTLRLFGARGSLYGSRNLYLFLDAKC